MGEGNERSSKASGPEWGDALRQCGTEMYAANRAEENNSFDFPIQEGQALWEVPMAFTAGWMEGLWMTFVQSKAPTYSSRLGASLLTTPFKSKAFGGMTVFDGYAN